MRRNQFKHAIRFALRGGLFMAILLGLFAGGAGMQSAHATGTGSISGAVRDVSSIPITGFSIGVAAQDNAGNTLVSTCSDPATGAFTLSGVPWGTAVKVIADGGAFATSINGCSSSTYGYEYWPQAITLAGATSITLNSSNPNRTGINFTLATAVRSIEYLIFNMDRPRIDDPAVRRAIAYGTNRQSILDTVWGPGGTYGIVPDSYVAENAWAAATTTNSGLLTYPYSVSQARTELENAGWLVNPSTGIREQDSVALSLSFKTTTKQERVNGGALFVQEMQDIGIEVIPTYIDSTTFFGSSGPLATGDFDIAEYTTGNCASTEDHQCVPFPMFLTGDPTNDSRYSEPVADAEFAAFNSATTDLDKLAHAITHQTIVLGALPVLPLFTRTDGSISGVIKDKSGVPFTGMSIEVQAQDSASGSQVATTCTSSANGYYTLTGIPAATSVAVYATGGTGCSSDTSFNGWSYWNESGDVSELVDATPILLTAADPTRGGIDLSLGEAVPPIEYLIFNLDHAKLDKSVRQAIAYGTDRLHILDTVWLPGGIYGTVENSYVADNHWAKAPNASLHLYPYDPAQAAALLDADGWLMNGTTGIREKSNVPLSLSFKTTTMQKRQDTAAIFVQEMQDIGIEVIPEYIDSITFFGSGGPLATGSFDIAEYTTNYCRSTLDEYCVPFSMYHNGDASNNARYNSTSAEDEFAAFHAAGTHDERLTHAVNHQVIAMEDLPYLPLFTRTTPLTISGNTTVGSVILSYTDGMVKTVTSASNGSYSITVPFDWSGTITPSKTGVTFAPASRTYTNIISNQTAQNYAAAISFASTGSQDGWILESGENTNTGGTMNSVGTTFQLGDNASNKQYRTILSFNTASLPDTAIVQSALLKIKQSGIPTGSNPFTLLGTLRVDIRKPYFGTLSTLQLSDFNAASVTRVGTFGSSPSSGWYTATLSATGRTNINKTSLTQVRLYFSMDDNNDRGADFMKFFSGNYMTNTTYRPVLVVTYRLP